MTLAELFPIPMQGAAAITAGVFGGTCSVGLAIGFLIADPRSPTARALAV